MLSLGSRHKKIIASLIVIVVIAFLIQFPIKTWLTYSYARGPVPEGLIKASEYDPSNPDYNFLIAYYSMEYGDQSSWDTIQTQYKKALTLSPFNYNYWLHLAEYFYQKGDREKALYALNKATSLSPGTVSLRWRAGMLAEKLGDKDFVMANLGAVIKSDQKRRTKAFGLLWQSINDKDKIFDLVPENALYSYLGFLLATDRIDEAGVVFDTLVKLNYDTSQYARRYVSNLIQNGDIESAIRIWESNYGSWQGVWNGGFDQDLTQGGFEWRIRNIEGAKIKRDSMNSFKDRYSLKVAFDGSTNVDFRHLSQIIPVEGGSDYTLKMFVKSDEILSTQDLHWRIYCLNMPDFRVTSEPIQGTFDWKPLSISFKAPDECSAINIRLTREKSNKINNQISGTLWIDEVEIVKHP